MIAYNLTKTRSIYRPFGMNVENIPGNNVRPTKHSYGFESCHVPLMIHLGHPPFIACNFSSLLSPFLHILCIPRVFVRIVVGFKNSLIVSSKYKIEEALKYVRQIGRHAPTTLNLVFSVTWYFISL